MSSSQQSNAVYLGSHEGVEKRKGSLHDQQADWPAKRLRSMDHVSGPDMQPPRVGAQQDAHSRYLSARQQLHHSGGRPPVPVDYQQHQDRVSYTAPEVQDRIHYKQGQHHNYEYPHDQYHVEEMRRNIRTAFHTTSNSQRGISDVYLEQPDDSSRGNKPAEIPSNSGYYQGHLQASPPSYPYSTVAYQHPPIANQAMQQHGLRGQGIGHSARVNPEETFGGAQRQGESGASHDGYQCFFEDIGFPFHAQDNLDYPHQITEQFGLAGQRSTFGLNSVGPSSSGMLGAPEDDGSSDLQHFHKRPEESGTSASQNGPEEREAAEMAELFRINAMHPRFSSTISSGKYLSQLPETLSDTIHRGDLDLFLESVDELAEVPSSS
ncbi:uncharacterized protein RCC_09910 [Ramularia collo-cygni]|uniref:Uncharacterized protein n=1 Tax=Ramularia collo-cygni TaxID=112498 RepID=A0A2D3V863_9PEZI|nr:uncharacterized protein RCC_09910 [Ramularia collo-cygni]CZT24193.1 uncharacterized protein RCC_09910 [Ramularia collo-cygni]